MSKTHTVKTPKTINPSVGDLRKVYEDGVKFIDSYFFFEDPRMVSVCVLWCIATWFVPCFDTFGILTIWATLKRCGKSSLMKALAFMCHDYLLGTDISGPALFSHMSAAQETGGSTVAMDESEKLSNENDPRREYFNVAPYRGIGVVRQGTDEEGNKTSAKFELFSPIMIVMIGNVYDTLRDRSISVEMTRMIGQQKKRFLHMIAQPEGETIGKRINPLVARFTNQKGEGMMRDTMMSIMLNETEIDSRDLEMWAPILSVAKIIGDDIYKLVLSVATRMVFSKTAPAKQHKDLKDRERQQLIADFAPKALKDLAELAKKGDLLIEGIAEKMIAHNDLWKLFKGDGITSADICEMLKLHGIESKTIRKPGTNGRSKDQEKNVSRGYKASSIIAAYKRIEYQG
jgi:hypothetical protein